MHLGLRRWLRLFLDEREGGLLGNVSEHPAGNQRDYADNEGVLERGRGDHAKLVATQGETGDSRVSEYTRRNVAQHRRLGRIHKNENCDQDANRGPKWNAERAAERNLSDQQQRDQGHDRAEYIVRERLGESGLLAAAMVKCRPGDERNPDLHAHGKRRQEDICRNASEHADADRQCSNEIHSVLPCRYALTRFFGGAKLDTELASSAVGADVNLWLNFMQCRYLAISPQHSCPIRARSCLAGPAPRMASPLALNSCARRPRPLRACADKDRGRERRIPP